MGLKAFPQYLYAPAIENEALRGAENAFNSFWLPMHDISDGFQLYHYTDLLGLRGIVWNRELWLSHVSSFNDPGEIEYGKKLARDVVTRAMQDEERKTVRDFYGLLREAIENFSKFHHYFLICLWGC